MKPDQDQKTQRPYRTSRPTIRSRITRSRDGQFVIHTTEITHIKPAAYYEAILAGKSPQPDVDEGEVAR